MFQLGLIFFCQMTEWNFFHDLLLFPLFLQSLVRHLKMWLLKFRYSAVMPEGEKIWRGPPAGSEITVLRSHKNMTN